MISLLLPPLYGEMTPEEYLRFVAQAKGLRREESARQIETVMEKTRIADVKIRDNMTTDYDKVIEMLGGGGTSARVAKSMIDEFNSLNNNNKH